MRLEFELHDHGARFTMSRALLVGTRGKHAMSENPYEPPKSNDDPPSHSGSSPRLTPIVLAIICINLMAGAFLGIVDFIGLVMISLILLFVIAIVAVRRSGQK